jgi:predicted transcriptional regulator
MAEKIDHFIVNRWMTKYMDIKGIELCVFAIIYTYPNNAITYRDFANLIGCKLRTVQRAIEILEEKNYITRKKQTDVWKPYIYSINYDYIKSKARR